VVIPKLAIHLSNQFPRLVNFRGSLGFGKAFVDTLAGHVGDKDISDCIVLMLPSFPVPFLSVSHEQYSEHCPIFTNQVQHHH